MIKFRVFNIQDYEYIDNLQPILVGFDGSVKDVYNKQDISEDVIVEQGTGVLDRDGKEIYENDIINTSSYGKKSVRFKKGCFGVVNDQDQFITLATINPTDMLILGNINEHECRAEK